MKEKLAMLEECFDLDEGAIAPEMVLADQDWWDSLAYLSFIVLIGDEYGKKLSGEDIRAMRTVQDMLNHMA